MFLGHIGVALAAKRAAPRASLGTLLVAATLLDGVWALLCPTGLDHTGIAPVLMTAVRPDFDTDSFSHSLLFASVMAIMFGLAYFSLRHSARGALTIAALVLSHPLLDAPGGYTHITLFPGTAPMPLRGALPLLLVVESVLFLAGLVIYLRCTRARDRVGSWGLGTTLVAQLALFAAAIFPAHPLEVQALALATLGTFLFAPLGFWIDRHRREGGTLGPELLASQLGSRGLAVSMFL